MQRLETNRIILRDFLLEDLEDFYEYAKNPKVGPMAGWKPHETKEDTLEILQMFRKKQEVWAIYHKEDQQVIGSVGVHRKSLNGSYELGYVLSEDYWGQGLVLEASESIIEYCFDTMEIDVLYVEHFEENVQSRRVIEKLGFTFVELLKESFTVYNGEKKNCLKYKIEKEDYYAKAKGNI